MSILKLVKNFGAATVSSIHNMSFIFAKFEQSNPKKTKQNKEMNNLGP
jgi:hypothetical protein